MAMRIRYHLGGFDPNAPAQNLAERWSNGTQPTDAPTGYTAWDTAGSVTTQRALTTQENDALTAVDTSVTSAANTNTLQQRAQAALAVNATFLAIGTPTNAQTVNQVQTLTKECSALIRLLLGLLDSTSGT